jgi:hypothetical protein
MSGFDSLQGKVFLSSAQRLGLEPIQPPIQWVSEAISKGIKRQTREADRSIPSSVEIKNNEAMLPPHSPNPSSWLSAQLIKHRGKFISTTVDNTFA